MIDQSRLLFIHGLMGSSQGFKANLLRQLFPEMIIPDFPGQFPDRMDQLRELIGAADGWTIIGSSLGGLMATWFVLESPKQVDRLILLAPALPWLPEERIATVDMPAVIYHGRDDDTVPLNKTRQIAQRVFADLVFHEVDDDHGLSQTVQDIDWPALLDS